MGLAGDLAELLLRPGLDLPDSLLGHAQLSAELLQGLFGGASEAETAFQDPSLAGIELAEQAVDRFPDSSHGTFVLVLVRSIVGGRSRTWLRGP